MRFVTALFAACLALGAFAVPAGAQAYGPSITLFASPNFSGGQRTYSAPVSSLANVGFSDVAASVTIRAGTWQLCDRAGYSGRCITLEPGRYQLAGYGMDYKVASIHPMSGGYGGGGSVGTSNVSGSVGTSNISGPVGTMFIYNQPGLAGQARQIHGPIANLSSVGFGGRVWSASVVSGSWQVCTGVGYAPPCYRLTPGRYTQIFNSRGNLWSIRPT
jgi:hypothetical protein